MVYKERNSQNEWLQLPVPQIKTSRTESQVQSADCVKRTVTKRLRRH